MDDAKSLQGLLGDLDPESILVLGSLGEHFIDEYIAVHPHCSAEFIDAKQALAQLGSLARYDLVLVSHTIEFMQKDEAIRLIARLRDVHAGRLVLFVPMGDGWPGLISRWNKRDLLALGLVQMAEHDLSAGSVHIYGYDILTYKPRPDWLNNRFWANPALFDKYWW